MDEFSPSVTLDPTHPGVVRVLLKRLGDSRYYYHSFDYNEDGRYLEAQTEFGVAADGSPDRTNVFQKWVVRPQKLPVPELQGLPLCATLTKYPIVSFNQDRSVVVARKTPDLRRTVHVKSCEINPEFPDGFFDPARNRGSLCGSERPRLGE